MQKHERGVARDMSSVKVSDLLASGARKLIAYFYGSSLRMRREVESQLLICSIPANYHIREDTMAYKQLTDEQRYQIEALKDAGFRQTEITEKLGKSPSTISRELRRNSDRKGYRGKLAIKRTDRRRRGAKKHIKLDTAMCSMIKNLLGVYLSPEQISGRLLLELGVEISHET